MAKRALFDPALEKVCSKITLPELAKAEDIYLDLLEIIISQQLSGKVAKVIFNRFLELFDNNYPKPEILVHTKDDTLKNAGLSNSKTNYVKNLAAFALNNDLSINHIDTLSDNDILELLTKVKGIGKWSVEMLLIFSLERPDVFPFDDLVIKKSMIEIYGINKEGKELIKRMNSIANKWKPNRTLASRYLWANYDLKQKSKKGKE